MDILMIILYILLFIFCLSVLIMVHEAGHLVTAKLFKVYCLEYSIGFGPAILHKKRKDGETFFSLRTIPFGGYVSMYGEGVELPEGVEIDSSRSLEGIKKWKKCIILVAGVTMNAILALVLFFVSEVAFQKHEFYADTIKVEKDSIAEVYGLKDMDSFEVTQYDNVYLIDGNAKSYFNDEIVDTTVCLQRQIISIKEVSWNTYLHFYRTEDITFDEENNQLAYKTEKTDVEIDATYEKLQKVVFNLKVYDEGATEENPSTHDVEFTLNVVVEEGKRHFENTGVSLYVRSFWQPFGDVMKNTFVDFGKSSTAIIKGFGMLFTQPSSWSQMSGLVGIGFETTNILKNFGLGTFIYIWGLISVNLAIVNLFPFPGLDGWQLLVTVVEGATRKKFPEKVKNIVSFIGIGLLFLLMIAIIIKDVFTYII